ncbi:hypothetical protein L1765_13455 [Microaerobacter geothermalis]|uniref:hypothetical protein n=1 Tax=Microaerobacter geothermalis TaxID=674972 RepID=UPI001F346E90|nr:hypothetical protein [Microaerobacter geothermalis]MCF6094967.1 hypothetical protein [Microaerobacter geothermalis]
MWVVLGILFIAGIIALIEVPSLLKKNLKKELWVFSILLFIGTGLSIVEGLQINLPNPLDWITIIYKPLSDLIFGLL